MKKIIEAGNQHAIKALEMFTGMPVTPAFTITSSSEGIDTFSGLKKEGELIIITTDIIGEIKGRSYFICNKEEWNYISGIAVKGMRQDSSSFREAFMTELDNIISAAFITKIAEAFSCKMYGAPPVLAPTLANVSINEYLSTQLTQLKNSSYYVSICEIAFHQPEIHPLFMWALPDLQAGKNSKVETSRETETLKCYKG
jgi:chemotaxis protein CheY-P-specific phosphatase CheC